MSNKRLESWVGKRVRVESGLREFHGSEGVVLMVEGDSLRVKLDVPVEVPLVGLVSNDLWEPKGLKALRRRYV